MNSYKTPAAPATEGAPWITEQNFECSHCGSRHYNQVQLHRPNRLNYALPLFYCQGCSAVFTDPWMWTARQPNGYQVPPAARSSQDPRQVRRRAPG